jgi:hypothetical protein
MLIFTYQRHLHCNSIAPGRAQHIRAICTAW